MVYAARPARRPQRCRPDRRRSPLIAALALGVAAAVGPQPATGQEDAVKLGPEERELTDGKVFISYLMPPDGLITADVVDRWEKRLTGQLESDPEIRFVVVRIASRGVAGGDLGPVERIAERLASIRKTTIAHIDHGDQAANGAALVALACRKVALGEGARIGYLDDPEAAVDDDDENDARRARSLFAQEAVRRPRIDSSLAEALISKFHSPIFRVELQRQVGNNLENDVQIMSEAILRERQKDLVEKMRLRIVDKTEIAPRGERLTLTTAQAKEYGVADVVLANRFDDRGRSELLDALRIAVASSNVIDEYQGPMGSTSIEGKTLINFLNHPVTRFLLLLFAFLGLVLEFKMPGTFIPIACSGVCFLLFFVGGMFPAYDVTGVNAPTTNWFELVLFLMGTGMVVIELFVLPGVIFFGLFGLIIMFVSLVLAMAPPGDATGAATMTVGTAITVLVTALGAGFGVFYLLLRFLPRSSFFNRSGLISNAAIQGIPNADNIVEEQERTSMLLGKTGVVVTPLRPAGKVEIEGRLLDVVAEGDFIEKGESVEVVDASVFRAVVRRRPGGGSSGAGAT